jgi:hypothetical protein
VLLAPVRVLEVPARKTRKLALLYRTATVQVAIPRPDHDSSFSGSSTPSAMSRSISAQYSRLWKP